MGPIAAVRARGEDGISCQPRVAFCDCPATSNSDGDEDEAVIKFVEGGRDAGGIAAGAGLVDGEAAGVGC